MEPFRGAPIVTYHKSWIYFAERFSIHVAGELEPKSGIPPTSKHLSALKKTMKEKNIKVIVRDTYHESRTPKKVAKETGATVVLLSQSVGSVKSAKDFMTMTGL